MDNNTIRPVQLLKLTRVCLDKHLSKQQLVEIMKPIREEQNPEVIEQIAQRLIAEVEKL